ncbi:(2Fe-2S)-binding protein [Desulfosporosinus sp. BICA1-9]|uniref:(2Fe-2S)-binding protein n=1 Tax=Desulfosporosinus sp. BICA1-9 TaxID=1531958 RepID=UPI00054B08C8|nr:(2Fe-2S)-binding protein [Desulfosporosinus sp. BICA1-9]KJS46161.1 MAG: (2Fe-2S)-binding protein [Peptococcaceae bacterium BRH_c23]KJS90071.1 MAG: (2Fe-2S)-binding protein [Desulfosporosinus sp. BICA1-9]HBW36309.1 (2Fe-2S)-binding protein [Desulfosporosinus sp.]
MSKSLINFILNSQKVSAQVDSDMRLVDFLRDEMGLTGTKIGCEEGGCGACTVIIDAQTANSCLVLAPQIDGKEVTTIEGLGSYEHLHPLQEAFIEEGAVQCGFCTPGMLLSAKALLDVNSNPKREEIIRSISGNLCRCTGYTKIANAIEKVVKTKGNRAERSE